MISSSDGSLFTRPYTSETNRTATLRIRLRKGLVSSPYTRVLTHYSDDDGGDSVSCLLARRSRPPDQP